MNRSEIIHKNFIQRIRSGNFPTTTPVDTALSHDEIVDLVETQFMSRLLDVVSRRLSSRKQSFYTIGSSGHEGNAVFGKVFRQNDIAFLHYRSCAFAIQRSKKDLGSTPLFDTLLAFAASSEDPISGGRHKVIGSKRLYIPPQTSTIASHLPKAMGAAHALGLYPKVDHEDVGLNDDSIVICSFGDASVNHSTAQGAINTAAWAAYQMSPMPIIFICEDNGIGISTHTPKGWIEANYAHKPGLKYIGCDGRNILDIHRASTEAESYVRRFRRPVFLHFKTVRLMGHAGSDIESSYHSNMEISHTEADDPLLHSAKILIDKNILTTEETCDLYNTLEIRIERIAEHAIKRPRLTDPAQVMSSIWPTAKERKKVLPGSTSQRAQVFATEQRYFHTPLNMSRHINLALADIMLENSNAIVFGEDVAIKGGVYGVTRSLHEKFGPARVTNTVLDEQSILGLAIGLAQCGYLPIAEIQYLAYIHNAEDQIRGEAATASFFSNAQYANPMVIRIAGFAYQKGFGGHFHNDNSFTVFRDIPGIVVAAPSNGADAAQMLRIGVDMARHEQKVVIIIEPIALYGTMDLHQDDDKLWASHYQPPSQKNAFNYGDVNVLGDGNELCILSYANGFYLSNKAAKVLNEQHQLKVRLVDLRWLHPLPEEAILNAIADCHNVLIVDECRKSGSASEAIVALLVEDKTKKNIARLNAEDCFIPLGEAANLILPSVENIVQKALRFIHTDDKKSSRVGAAS